MTTLKSKYIHPLTPEVALEVASNLRPDDFREISEGYGLDPKVYLPIMAQEYPSGVYFTSPNGKIAGMAGVGKQGDIWMLCTPVIHEQPTLFARQAKRYVDNRTEPLLWNKVDYRNKVHLKLLKFLGFTFLRKFEWGPNNVTFIEFCRVHRR
jgi:hypothetical protein